MQKNMDDELEKQRLDLQLDKELQDTFPASDALKITRRKMEIPKPSKRPDNSGRRRKLRSPREFERGSKGEAS